MKRALYEDYTVWQPAGDYDPITFWYEAVDFAVMWEAKERLNITGPPMEHAKTNHDVMAAAAVEAVTRWEGFDGDPECTKEARAKFFGAPANHSAVEAVWGSLCGRDPNAANKKKASSAGSASNSPTPPSSAESAETPEASDGAATS